MPIAYCLLPTAYTLMMNGITIINPIGFPNWDDLILSHPEGTIFHTSAWAGVLRKSYHYTPLYFTAFEGGRIAGLLPVMEVKSFLTGKRGVSLPFTDYCDPIMNDGLSFKELFDRVVEFGRKQNWRYIELRISVARKEQGVSSKGTTSVSGESASSEGSPVSPFLSPNTLRLTPDASSDSPTALNLIPTACSGLPDASSDSPVDSFASPNALRLTPNVSYLGHVVDLDGNAEETFGRFRDSARRNIRKAGKEGVEVGIFDSSDSVREFYRLNCMTRRDHGLPPQPGAFFRNIHHDVISKGLGFVALASYQGKRIAGAVFLHFGKKAVYKYGASDRRYQHLRANNLVMWEAIKWHCQNGYRSLCLGRTEPENQGLIQFKSALRPSEHPIHYYRYDLKKGAFVNGSSRVTGFHNEIFKRMPLPILNKIGSVLYRHVG